MFREPPTGLADGRGLGLSFDARGADMPQLAWVPRIPRVAQDLGRRECYHTGLHPRLMRIVRRYVISGRVQGVGFRYFVQSVASRESIAGWVRNLDDGRVEAVAAGDADAIGRFERALRQAPDALLAPEVPAAAGVRIARLAP